MTRISSRYKQFFPLLWFGVSAFCVAWAVLKRESLMYIVGLCIVEVIGFVFMMLYLKFLIKIIPGHFVDEVYDCGGFLLVKHRGEEDRVAMSNIVDVRAWIKMIPPAVTLQLVNPGKFGEAISFMPRAQFTISPYANYPIVADLIARVDGARLKRVLCVRPNNGTRACLLIER